MVLKDWERGTKYWNKDFWYHKGDDAGLMVNQVKRHTDKKWVWEFYAENKRQTKDEQRFFKTKSEALAYAKEYMRKH